MGVKYETKAQAMFGSRYGARYFPSQWLRYSTPDDPRIRWCQPDGVLFVPWANAITIIEFKYSHTEVAWWQLFQLYTPVLRRLFAKEKYEIRCCEVVKWFDPAVRAPQRAKLREDIEAISPGEFAVHIFNP